MLINLSEALTNIGDNKNSRFLMERKKHFGHFTLLWTKIEDEERRKNLLM